MARQRKETEDLETKEPETSCDHEWIGHAGGVECVRCGKQLTTEEYRKLI